MASILFRMQETAQQYVEILGEILGIDVSIIDAEQIRIAGSGRMKTRTGSMASYGNIVLQALRTKSTVVVERAKEDPICDGCQSRDICDNLSEIWSPILLDGEPIGVIGCVCYNEEQREKFLKQQDIFIRFFNEFSGLLESKAHDIVEVDRGKSVRNILEHVLGRAQIGVFILDSYNRVVSINDSGKQLLQLNEGSRFEHILLSPLNGGKPKEYELSYAGGKKRVIAEIEHIHLDPYYDTVVLFVDAEFSNDLSGGLLGIPPTPKSELDRIIGHSPAIRSLKKSVQAVASSTSSVLITGESGTGKELVARAIHGESPRHDHPFIAINCAALPENLLESELFGYVKGAFTGASPQGKTGLLEAAEKGTFFLDEIGDMPISIQVKLLRVLEQREIRRLGSNQAIPIDVRFVFATNCDLEEMVHEGTFRKDLYYRINVIPLYLPPLRERGSDIRLIASSFIQKFSIRMNKPCLGVGEDFWLALEQYSWPGNVRELQNAIEYAVNMMPISGILRAELLHGRLKLDNTTQNHELPIEPRENWNLESIEAEILRRRMDVHKDERDAKRIVAQELGIGVATLYRKLKKYHLLAE